MSQHKLLALLFPLIKYNWSRSFSRGNRCSRKTFSLQPSAGSQLSPGQRRVSVRGQHLPAQHSGASPWHSSHSSTRRSRCKSQKNATKRKKGTTARPPPTHTYTENWLHANRTVRSLSPRGTTQRTKKKDVRQQKPYPPYLILSDLHARRPRGQENKAGFVKSKLSQAEQLPPSCYFYLRQNTSRWLPGTARRSSCRAPGPAPCVTP